MAVYSPDGPLQLEVEVKTRRGATKGWAARLLRNMVFHEVAPASPYFMLVLPEKLYLWDLRRRTLTERMLLPEAAPVPDYGADAGPVFSPYIDPYPDAREAPASDLLGEDGLTFVVAPWCIGAWRWLRRDMQAPSCPAEGTPRARRGPRRRTMPRRCSLARWGRC